jgi:hypothetical protein
MQVPEKCHQNTMRMRNHITPQRRQVVTFAVRTNLTLPPAAGVVEPLLVEPLLLEGWAAVGAAQKEPRVAPVTGLNQIRINEIDMRGEQIVFSTFNSRPGFY